MGSGRIRAEKAKHSKIGEDQANSVFRCSFPPCDVFRKHWQMTDSALLGRDEVLVRAGFGGTGLADFGVAGLAGPNKNGAAADPKANLLPTPAGSDLHGI